MKCVLRRIIFYVKMPMAVAVLIVLMAGMSRAPVAADMRVTIEQLEDGRMQVAYDLARPSREIILGELAGGHRERRWTVETPGFRLLRLNDEDRIVRVDGEQFEHVDIIAAPDLIRLPKEYQPIARYGEGGMLVYTGHFWPMTGKGGRVNVTFSFTPAVGAKVVAFGARSANLKDWRSPMAHPAFVYMGPLKPVETEFVTVLVDPAAPGWIIEEFDDLAPQTFDYLATAFGFSPQTKPNLFLAAPLGRDEGRLSFAGDALPGQFQITLEGAAWNNPTDQAKRIFRRSTIHEAFHLWQSAAAQPSVEEEASWIHEGGADAVAVEAMLALGYWDGVVLDAFTEQTREDCAAGLEDGSLASAHQRRNFKALYACGYLIADAIARADGTTATAFWRDFMARASDRGEYSEGFFYDFVEARTGDKEFVKALRYFVRTPLADPDREIARLMAAASAPLAPSQAR